MSSRFFSRFVLGDVCGNLWVFAVVFYDFLSEFQYPYALYMEIYLCLAYIKGN